MSDPDSDYFVSLADALILLIFNKLQDSKSLTTCLLVSKRFSSLVLFTNSIFISIPPPRHLSKPNPSSHLRLLLHNLFLKPLKCFHQIMARKPPTTRSLDTSYCLPNGILNNFKEMQSLHLKLPSFGEDLGSSDGGASFLKWKAEFGSKLKTCIILGATSFNSSNKCSLSSLDRVQLESMEQTLTDDELKLRVIWTISCLIAASTRHHLFKKILADHPMLMLQRVMVSDAKKQGKFYMGSKGIIEMKNSMNSEQFRLPQSSSAMMRTPVPELNMKLWYLPKLELPESGYEMKGATLVLTTPVDGMAEKKNINGELMLGSLDLEADGKAFSEAVREMIKVKKSYLMTMSSF